MVIDCRKNIKIPHFCVRDFFNFQHKKHESISLVSLRTNSYSLLRLYFLKFILILNRKPLSSNFSFFLVSFFWIFIGRFALILIIWNINFYIYYHKFALYSTQNFRLFSTWIDDYFNSYFLGQSRPPPMFLEYYFVVWAEESSAQTYKNSNK